MLERLDLQKKSSWSVANGAEIAEQLGFIHGADFDIALAVFISRIVSKSSNTQFLASLAINHISNAGVRRVAIVKPERLTVASAEKKGKRRRRVKKEKKKKKKEIVL